MITNVYWSQPKAVMARLVLYRITGAMLVKVQPAVYDATASFVSKNAGNAPKDVAA